MNKLALGGLLLSAAAAVVGVDTMRSGPISTFAAETLRLIQCSGTLPNGMPCPSPKTAQSIPAVKPPAGTENLTLWADIESNKPGLILERGSGIAAAPGGLWADQVYSGLKENQKQLVIDNGRWVGDPTGLSGKSCEMVAGTTKIKCGNDPEVELKGANGSPGAPGKSCAMVPGTTKIKCGSDAEVELKGATGSPGSPGSPGTSCAFIQGTTRIKCGNGPEVDVAGSNGAPGKSCAIVPGTTRIKCGSDAEVELKGEPGSPGSPGNNGLDCANNPACINEVKKQVLADAEIQSFLNLGRKFAETTRQTVGRKRCVNKPANRSGVYISYHEFIPNAPTGSPQVQFKSNVCVFCDGVDFPPDTTPQEETCRGPAG